MPIINHYKVAFVIHKKKKEPWSKACEEMSLLRRSLDPTVLIIATPFLSLCLNIDPTKLV